MSVPRRGYSRRRRILFAVLALTLSLAATLALLEWAARVYAYSIARHGKRYETDAQLGWSFRPNADFMMRASDGSEFRFVTNSKGVRVAPDEREREFWEPGAERKVLILADSFGEGESMDIESRMDYVMSRSMPHWTIRAVGCSGYSAEHELLLARQMAPELAAGDAVVLLTCSNDLDEMLWRTKGGRAKPWCEIVDGQVRLHPPQIGLHHRLRDRSFLFGLLISRMLQEPFPDRSEHVRSGRMYVAMVKQIKAALPPGVAFVVAYHTGNGRGFGAAGDIFTQLDESGIPTLDLDTVVGTKKTRPENFLPCRHWTVRGNTLVAQALLDAITGQITVDTRD
ncbi:MAG: hypothetical protein ACT4QC_07950 [Planctomycetaceae bacterium]